MPFLLSIQSFYLISSLDIVFCLSFRMCQVNCQASYVPGVFSTAFFLLLHSKDTSHYTILKIAHVLSTCVSSKKARVHTNLFNQAVLHRVDYSEVP